MSSLSFDFAPDHRPLAARLRPRTLAEYTGQQHLLAPDKPLAKAIVAGRIGSVILWGPPGTGKTTLAELIAHYCQADVIRLSAVTAGVKDIREAVEQAQLQRQMRGQRTLVFVDEVHRFNKSQQDAFLPYIEDGTFIFVGATTENPSFALNNALLSRTQVCVLKRLTDDDLAQLVQRALSCTELGLGSRQLTIAPQAQEVLVSRADGDARRLLNMLEQAANALEDGQQISFGLLQELLPQQLVAYDAGGDLFYDLISAFHKSVRGSNAEAALYWYCRILEGGGDPLYVARRLLAIASEDIGNADPRALQLALTAFDTFQRVGPAEGERAIAQAAIYCALAPKSNAVYQAFNQWREIVKQSPSFPVPEHLRNAPTNLMKSLGYGNEYRYAHDEMGAYSPGQTYLPDALLGTQCYQPTDRGLEKQLAEKLRYLAMLDAQAPTFGATGKADE